MVLLVTTVLGTGVQQVPPPRYQSLFWSNLIAAYGMLITFSIQGYATFSIAFSTLSVLISYIFAASAWRDISRSALASTTKRWLKAALFYLVISSVGTFYLAYLMKSGNVDHKRQLAAVYFYLHFQYNGWFFLICMALASHWFHIRQLAIRHEKWIQFIFILGCIPAYMLSILWYDLPIALYSFLVCVVILQVAGWAIWLHSLWQNRTRLHLLEKNSMIKMLVYCVVIAASIKFILQAFSVIPSLSVLAYSFRPIVIGYLHLVLLGIITLFLLTYIFQNGFFPITRLARIAVLSFVIGIIFNEALLMLQGVGGLVRIYIPNIPYALAGAAAVMFISLILLFAIARRKQTKSE
jgi:hypothetical protein